jgi:methylmalonyl-CoA/ethylmalonyl-CoA epimerase
VRFHHTGVACYRLEDEERWYTQYLGYQCEGEIFVDPLQGIRGRFLTSGESRIELVEALPESEVLAPWLRRGVTFYHLAFEVSDLEAAIGELDDGGARLVSPPTPAVAFAGRRVAFVMRPKLTLVELIESEGPS